MHTRFFVDYEFDPNSPALLRNPLTPDEFRKYIKVAENSPTISFVEAKEKWTKQTEQMLKMAANKTFTVLPVDNKDYKFNRDEANER